MRNLIRHLSVLLVFMILIALSVLISFWWLPKTSALVKSLFLLTFVLTVFAFIGALRLRWNISRHVYSFFSNTEPAIQKLNTNALVLSDESQALKVEVNEVIHAVHQTSEAVAEILSQIRLTEANTDDALLQGRKNLENTADGSRAVDGLSRAMNQVRESSKQITIFSDVLEEIALQTNILALNAAVEAAHAGAHAGGFNVIANSIRDLSTKSADAAKQIQKLVRSTHSEIEVAHQKTGDAQKFFREIQASTDKIEKALSQISSACSEQAVGTDHIGLAVGKIELLAEAVERVSSRIAQKSRDVGQETDQLLISSKFLKTLLTRFKQPMPIDGLCNLKSQIDSLGLLTRKTIDEKLTIVAGGTDLSRDHSILDNIRAYSGGVGTVFVLDSSSSDFVRISTNILNSEGARAVSTPLAAGKVKDALQCGNSFSGQLEILGRLYDCAYEPLLDGQELIGAIYFGYLIK